MLEARAKRTKGKRLWDMVEAPVDRGLMFATALASVWKV
jgi:adenine/guanine phosphoribosyltransferase-like PRPP-binding protein